ncbi:MAG: hypothetical protein KAH68_09350, partial [Draconibacterium sp.]|nr:hypothetical protein [Draconibacterium sp.]
MKKTLFFLMVFIISLSVFGQKLPFQGKLIESGTPVNGTRTIEFSIGTLGWNETHVDVPITDGLYFIVLGSLNVLPDSLFYGTTEQSLAITVDGTSLSPVILFKPLASPFEGSELVVKNDEGTVVGSMHAITDSITKNGELVVSGTSGNPNVTIGAQGDTGDQGSIQIHDSIGTIKAMLWSADVNGRFRLFGENTGKLNMGFSKPWDPNGGETIRDLPSVSLEVDGLYYSNLYVTQNDTAIRGRSYLSSNVGEFNMTRTDGHFMYKDGVLMSQYRFHDWGGTGYSGYFDLRGPNSRNIEMSSKHWVNADLPWFKLMGSQNQDVIQMSASEDSTESAYINLLSQDEKEASLYTTGL